MNTTTKVCITSVAVLASYAGIGATTAATAATAGCAASQLSVHLRAADGAAGSVYRPIVFTNTSESTCTLFGYPGVAYVAPNSGNQVGAAASRNTQHAAHTVTLAPGAKASALLQLVDYQNYSKSRCKPKAVSGLRVYPPGDTHALYAPFAHATKACSTKVAQLSVEATRKGRKG